MNAQVTALYQKFGFSLMPLRTDDRKRPAFEWKKLQRERCTLADLQRWLQRFEGFGVITGRLSGIVVVDLDSLTALTWAKQNLPPTDWIVLTGMKNGLSGQHWYYRWNDDLKEDPRNRARIFVGSTRIELDWRGEGGYVVAPGSPHESGVLYEQTRTWTTEDNVPIFDPAWFPEEDRPSAQPSSGHSSDSELTPEQRELKFSRWIGKRPPPVPGCRDNECYSAAAAGFDFGCSHGFVMDAVLSWNAEGVQPLPRRDVERTVNSAHKKRQPPKNPKGVAQAQQPKESSPRPASPSWGLPVTNPPEKTPEKSRTYTERSYIWAALGDKPTAQILAGFGEKRWRDRESRDAAAALKAVLARDEEPTQYNLSQELAAAGKFATFETLLEFCAKWITDDLHPSEAYRAFRDACDWDDFGAMLTAEVAQLNQGTCNKAASRLLDKVSAFVGTAKAVQKPKTLKQVVLDRLDEIESEDPDKKNIRLRLVDKYTGPFGGGDAVYACGPPKTGKTGLLMQMLRDAAQDGYTSLLGQLELREQQIADREGSYILGKSLTAFTAAERRYLRESNALANHERILVTPKFTDLEAYRSYVTMAFAQNKDIRIWATDYSEMVQDFGTKADQLAQTEAVSDFVKKTATAFDVLGILFTQPKEEYFKDCAHENRPRLTHWKRGRKYQQDAQALFFLHNPHEFDKSKPDNYLELYLQLCRSAPPAMIPLMVERSSFIYTEWKGDLPSGGGSTSSGKNHGGGQHAGRPIDIAAKIRQQAKSMSFEDLDGTPDIDLSGILGV